MARLCDSDVEMVLVDVDAAPSNGYGSESRKLLECRLLLLMQTYVCGWWSGVVIATLASITEVNQRRARLVLRRFSSRCRTFISACNQPATQGQLSLPSLRGR